MNNGSRKIVVEDLLRLKRAERPAPDFWSRFDAEMRAKQLAAIVVRRPWWDGLSQVYSRGHRLVLPFGAAAAMALVWTGVHYLSAPMPVAAPEAVAVPGTAAVAVTSVLPPITVVAVAETRPAKAEDAEDHREAAVVIPAPAPSSPSHLTKVPDSVQMAGLYGSPMVEGMGATLADFRALDADLAKRSTLASDRDFEPAAAHQTVSDPLTRIDPAQERLERLLAPSLPAYTATSASGRTFISERLRERASDDRMYESMDRGGASGMSLEFRF